jgi:hypothetical protein
MSYSHSYSDTIEVSGSKTITISYPASQDGGSVCRTVYYTERVPVNVTICVDADLFDQSVGRCNSSIQRLTGTVGAAQSAQTDAIDKSAGKIAQATLAGFFKTVRFETGAQITELAQKTEAARTYLHELAKRLATKKEKMQSEYSRMAVRYGKIFDDLNRELSNRMGELDKTAVLFERQTGQAPARSAGALAHTATVFGAESGDLHAKISASLTKKRALDAIKQIHIFLQKRRVSEQALNRRLLNQDDAAVYFLPVCLMETREEDNRLQRSVYQPPCLPEAPLPTYAEGPDTSPWGSLTGEWKDAVGRYFILELNRLYPAADLHTSRVKESIIRMFDSHSSPNKEI